MAIFVSGGASKHEYRGQCPKSHSDVIAYVINIKKVFCGAVIFDDLSLNVDKYWNIRSKEPI